MRLRLHHALVASLALSALIPGAAAAKVPTTDTLKIDIEASISERCGIAALGAKSKDGRIDVASTVTFNFKLDCNTPFRIGVAAENGALALVGDTPQLPALASRERGDDGFATRKRYIASLKFNTDQEGLVDAGECDSNDLKSWRGECRFFGDRPGVGFSAGRNTTAIGREGALTVRWQGEDAEPVRLAAGDYRETLTIVVGPRT